MGWTPPTASMCQGRGVMNRYEGASYGKGYDHRRRLGEACVSGPRRGADGSVAFRKKISRVKLLPFLSSQPRCVVAMEACAGAHGWARDIQAQGHEVRLIAPAYVKPFVKRQKNDMADAEAIT